jgi:PleD family two-component response regulator
VKLNNRNKIQLTDDESRNIRVFSDILNAENNRVFLVSIGKSAVNQALMLQCNSFIVDCDIPGNESLQNRPEHYFSEI